MTMHWIVFTKRCVTVSLLTLLGTRYLALAADANAEAVGPVHAKAWTLFKVSFPNQGEVKAVSLSVSTDGNNFRAAEAGLPNGWNLFKSMTYDVHQTTVLVSVVADWSRGEERFLFDEAGIYWLRWGIAFEKEDIAGMKIHQTLRVLAPCSADAKFLGRLSGLGFLRDLLGPEFFAGIPSDEFRAWATSANGADWRALIVIHELLEATRADDLGRVIRARGSIENALRWADVLLQLAKQVPESSYTPYAAYYAAWCYSAAIGDLLDRTMKQRGIDDSSLTEAKLRALAAEPEAAPHYSKAQEALTLAANRADLYLKPRAVYMQAILVGMRGGWDEMERLLDKAAAEAPGEGTIRQLVDGARRDLARVKQREQRQGGALEND